jgi:hypothetical protein
MKLTGFPRPVARDAYAQAIENVVHGLSAQPAVQAIYQVGGIRSPGISDIDLLVVFRDDADCTFDPLATLSATGRYLFPHSQFGVPARSFSGAVRFGFFHDYRLLWGQPPPVGDGALGPEDLAVANRQAGVEYLLKMYLSMCIERCYGIARVRNLLLLGRALRYDLEYVGAAGGPLDELVEKVIGWREAWFENPPAARAIVAWHGAALQELGKLLQALLEKQAVFAPQWADLKIARNQELLPGARLKFNHRGITLPAMFGGLGRKYFNLQHRFNAFTWELPITREGPAVLFERHDFVSAATSYNQEHLPHFISTPSALGIFRRRVPS